MTEADRLRDSLATAISRLERIGGLATRLPSSDEAKRIVGLAQNEDLRLLLSLAGEPSRRGWDI